MYLLKFLLNFTKLFYFLCIYKINNNTTNIKTFLPRYYNLHKMNTCSLCDDKGTHYATFDNKEYLFCGQECLEKAFYQYEDIGKPFLSTLKRFQKNNKPTQEPTEGWWVNNPLIDCEDCKPFNEKISINNTNITITKNYVDDYQIKVESASDRQRNGFFHQKKIGYYKNRNKKDAGIFVRLTHVKRDPLTYKLIPDIFKIHTIADGSLTVEANISFLGRYGGITTIVSIPLAEFTTDKAYYYKKNAYEKTVFHFKKLPDDFIELVDITLYKSDKNVISNNSKIGQPIKRGGALSPQTSGSWDTLPYQYEFVSPLMFTIRAMSIDSKKNIYVLDDQITKKLDDPWRQGIKSFDRFEDRLFWADAGGPYSIKTNSIEGQFLRYRCYTRINSRQPWKLCQDGYKVEFSGGEFIVLHTDFNPGEIIVNNRKVVNISEDYPLRFPLKKLKQGLNYLYKKNIKQTIIFVIENDDYYINIREVIIIVSN